MRFVKGYVLPWEKLDSVNRPVNGLHRALSCACFTWYISHLWAKNKSKIISKSWKKGRRSIRDLKPWPLGPITTPNREPNLIRIKADPNYLDRLNWLRRRTKFKRPKMLICVKLLAKYVIIIYALGSVHEKFGVWIKAVPKSLQRQNSRPG